MKWGWRRGGLPQVDISEKHGVRSLHLDGPAVQSAMRLKAPDALELEYTRAMFSFLMFRRAPAKLCLIGLGGGSIAKFVHERLPTTRITALEINPAVVAAARSYFFLPEDDERLTVLTADGAGYVYDHPCSQDVLMVDGYDAHRIVEDLASPAFYLACRAMLRDGGVALFNLWGSDRHFATYLQRIDAAFEQHTLQLPSEQKGNIVVLAFVEPLPKTGWSVLEVRARQLSVELGLEFPEFLFRMRHWNPCDETELLC